MGDREVTVNVSQQSISSRVREDACTTPDGHPRCHVGERTRSHDERVRRDHVVKRVHQGRVEVELNAWHLEQAAKLCRSSLCHFGRELNQGLYARLHWM